MFDRWLDCKSPIVRIAITTTSYVSFTIYCGCRSRSESMERRGEMTIRVTTMSQTVTGDVI